MSEGLGRRSRATDRRVVAYPGAPRGALRAALQADREALAEWQLTDGKKRRPEPSAPAIEREIEEKKADRDAAIAARDRVYEDKAAFVEKNRRRLIREADKATTEARTRCEQAIEAAENAHSDLVECRTAALWAARIRARTRRRSRTWPLSRPACEGRWSRCSPSRTAFPRSASSASCEETPRSSLRR